MRCFVSSRAACKTVSGSRIDSISSRTPPWGKGAGTTCLHMEEEDPPLSALILASAKPRWKASSARRLFAKSLRSRWVSPKLFVSCSVFKVRSRAACEGAAKDSGLRAPGGRLNSQVKQRETTLLWQKSLRQKRQNTLRGRSPDRSWHGRLNLLFQNNPVGAPRTQRNDSAPRVRFDGIFRQRRLCETPVEGAKALKLYDHGYWLLCDAQAGLGMPEEVRLPIRL